MEKLYLETPNGRVPIDPKETEKLNLKKGEHSPFTRGRIVDRNGKYTDPQPEEKETADLRQKADGVETEDGALFSTSEIIDISRGEDSKTES